MTKPMVSVVMITYGHEQFIEQAINGVLMQNCNFDVELIVANDCSPDNTDEVIQKIIQNHPKSSWIKYIKHENNIGMTPNFIFAMDKCQGKYISLCEGDDYWTDASKLQTQFNFLESNSKCSGCFHNVYNYRNNEGLKTIARDENLTTTEFGFDDLISKNHIATCSFFFRKSILAKNKNWKNYKNLIDDLLVLIIALDGKIKYINQLMAVYRIHVGGISSMRDRETGTTLMIKYQKEILNYFKNEEPNIDRKPFYNQIAENYKRLTVHYLNNNKFIKFFKNLIITVYYNFFGNQNVFKIIIKPVFLIIKRKAKI